MTDDEFAAACRRVFADVMVQCAASARPQDRALAAMMTGELRRRGIGPEGLCEPLKGAPPLHSS